MKKNILKGSVMPITHKKKIPPLSPQSIKVKQLFNVNKKIKFKK